MQYKDLKWVCRSGAEQTKQSGTSFIPIGEGRIRLKKAVQSYFKLRKAFSKFYRIHSALLEKYSVSLKTLLQQGISEPEFYGDLVYI